MYALERIADTLAELSPAAQAFVETARSAALPKTPAGRTVAEMVRDMVTSDECDFDHGGGCQAHGYLSLEPGEMCPQEEAKQWLAALETGDPDS